MNAAILVPVLMFSGFFFVIDFLLYRSLLRMNIKPNWLKLLKLALILVFLSSVLIFSYYFFNKEAQRYSLSRTYLSGIIFSIYLAKLFYVVLLLPQEIYYQFKRIRSFFSRAAQKSTQKNALDNGNTISRGAFIQKAALGVSVIPLYLSSRGVFADAYNYKVHYVPLFINNLPKELQGIKIIQMSDFHAGSLSDKDKVYEGIKQIKALQADLFFFTGDMVNNFYWEADDYLEMLAEIRKPMGQFASLGNHDYGIYHNWSSEAEKQKNFEEIKGIHKKIGWQLLNNAHEVIGLKGKKIGILGVENWGHSMRFPKLADLDLAKSGMQDVAVKLLLSHDPSHWDYKVLPNYSDIDVMFSGHTHGAQFGIENSFLKWSPAKYIYPQWAGIYQNKQQQLYVNRGFGFIGYPGRIGILPEISLFELKQG